MSLDVTVRGIVIPADELSWRFSRSQGPGGQSVNTTDSQAELSFDVAASAALPPVLKERALSALAGRLAGGVITVAASEFRSQLRNRELAFWMAQTATSRGIQVATHGSDASDHVGAFLAAGLAGAFLAVSRSYSGKMGGRKRSRAPFLSGGKLGAQRSG